MKIFLGGTCNGSKWREELITKLEEIGIDYFNPVVSVWNEEAQKREIEERQNCDFFSFPLHYRDRYFLYFQQTLVQLF
jgi:hypothetical protein